MNKVLDTNRKPLMPCHARRARKLLKNGRASVFRRYPFTIIIHDRTVEESVLQDVEIKIDQGSKTTGIALVVHGEQSSTVALGVHLEHRTDIKFKLDSRRAARHSRRHRKTRYRAPRFLNRTRPKGWLPPSVLSKAENILNWVTRFKKLIPISKFALETAKFDTQKLENPEISGTQYQQGRVMAGSTLSVGYGYTTKKNRISLGLPKDHWIDAAVCTAGGSIVKIDTNLKPLIIKATGRGSRQFCRMDKYGFPRTKAKPRTKNFFGFKTGDIVKVTIPEGARTKVPVGVYVGRVAVRSRGSFSVQTKDSKITVSHKYCKLIHLMDGYSYA